MGIKEQINIDLKNAMREGDGFKRDTLRQVMAAIKQVEVDDRKELSDGDIEKILQKQVKQRNDSIEQYVAGGRKELAEKEANEIAVIEVYLPKQLSDDELRAIIKPIVEVEKNMGKVMAKAKDLIGTRADGKRINQIAKELLG